MWESGSWDGPVGQWIRSGSLPGRSPGDPGRLRRPALDRAAGDAGDGADRGGPGHRPGAGHRPAAARCGCRRVPPAGCRSRSPAWPPRRPGSAPRWPSEIAVPGVTASRVIVAPAAPAGPAPAAVVLAKTQPWPSGCMRTCCAGCAPSLIDPTEEQYGFDQAFTAAAAGQAALRGSAVLTSPRGPAGISGPPAPGCGCTRRPATHPTRRTRPGPLSTAIRRPPGRPARTDAQPILTISWRHPRTVRRITIQRPPGAVGAAAGPDHRIARPGPGGQVGPAGSSGSCRCGPPGWRSGSPRCRLRCRSPM